MTEKRIMDEIRKAVNLDGRCRVVRNNTGVDQVTHVRYGLGLGGADLPGMIFRGPLRGRVFCLEIKRPKGPGPTRAQKLWLATVRRGGGFAAIARSEAEALAAVDRACAGALE